MDNTNTAFGWIHSYEDYLNMFDLSEENLNSNILVYPADISDFNHQMHENGHSVVSADQSFQLPPKDLENFCLDRQQTLVERLDQFNDINKQGFVDKWSQVVKQFIADFPAGKMEGRYQAMELPQLPVQNFDFDLALCPRCPFEAKDRSYHRPLQLIKELCRVAKQVRIFINLKDHDSIQESLGPMMVMLQQENFGLSFNEIKVDSPHQSTAMLQVWSRDCLIDS